MTYDPKARSRVITEGRDRAAARSYLKATGLTDEDIKKPIIGVASTWIGTMPCNLNLRALAQKVMQGIREAGATPQEFNTIAISDGITMGTEGMKTSLVSREVIADSIELVTRGHMFDAVICLVGCDKTAPGAAMALARLDIPGMLLYGGSIAPGRYKGRDITIQDVFEGVGAAHAGKITDDDLRELEDAACPGAGSCGGQFTANTMAIVMEFLGLAALGSAGVPAVDPRKDDVGVQAGHMIVSLLKSGVKPSDILTKEAFENAIAAAAATGGSTNSVLHLLALAREANVPLSMDDFNRVSARTPVITDLTPGGHYVATDMHYAGGTRLVAKNLLAAGLLHGDRPTPSGKTLAEEAALAEEAEGQKVISTVDERLQAARRHRHPARQPGPRRRGHQAGRVREDAVHAARPASSTAKKTPWRPSRPGAFSRATWSSSATKAPKAGRGCARCWASRRPWSGRAWAARSSW